MRLRPHRPGDIGWVVSRHGALYAAEYGWNLEFEALVAEIGAAFLRGFKPGQECLLIAEDATAAEIDAHAATAIPMLAGALLKNEQDLQLLERLAAVTRSSARRQQ